MNDERKTIRLQFIIHHSAFIVPSRYRVVTKGSSMKLAWPGA